MAGELTRPQFEALAELLRLREGSSAQQVAALVLVEGLEVGEAARRCNASYNAAHQAVKRCRRGLELAQVVACG